MCAWCYRQEVIVLVVLECGCCIGDGRKHETVVFYLLCAQQKRGTASANKKKLYCRIYASHRRIIANFCKYFLINSVRWMSRQTTFCGWVSQKTDQQSTAKFNYSKLSGTPLRYIMSTLNNVNFVVNMYVHKMKHAKFSIVLWWIKTENNSFSLYFINMTDGLYSL